MTIDDICKLLNANRVTKNSVPVEVFNGFSSDLMSDVLTVDCENSLLLTGLATVQTIRTAEMADISVVVLGRGKEATPVMIDLADSCDIILIECSMSLFRSSAILFNEGLKPIY